MTTQPLNELTLKLCTFSSNSVQSGLSSSIRLGVMMEQTLHVQILCIQKPTVGGFHFQADSQAKKLPNTK